MLSKINGPYDVIARQWLLVYDDDSWYQHHHYQNRDRQNFR